MNKPPPHRRTLRRLSNALFGGMHALVLKAFFHLVAAVCLLFLAACQRDARARVEKQLAGADRAQLRLDAARLYKNIYVSPGPDYVPVPAPQWPTSFTTLRPAQVNAYPDGIALVMKPDAEAEAGLLIVPEGITREPVATTRARFDHLAEGFYWYRFGHAARQP